MSAACPRLGFLVLTELRVAANSAAVLESAYRFATWLAGCGLECETQADPRQAGRVRWSISRTGCQADEADREAVMQWLAEDATLRATAVSPVHDLEESV